MNLLLDTHALLWALASPRRLARGASVAIRDPSNRVFFSSASTWEIAIKSSLGKISADLTELVQAAHAADFEPLAVGVPHTIRLLALPLHHRDPFDRILVAQALEERLIVVTRDRAFESYGVGTLFD